MSDVNTAVTLIKSGQKEEAQAMLKEIIRLEPHNIPAWFWMVETLETDADKLKVMEVCLKLNPGDQKVQKAYDLLKEVQREDAGGSLPVGAIPVEEKIQSQAEPETNSDKEIPAAAFAAIPVIQSFPEKFVPPPPSLPPLEKKPDTPPFVSEEPVAGNQPQPAAPKPALDPAPVEPPIHKPRKKRSWKWLIPAILVSFLVFLIAGLGFLFIQSLY
jgi:hypothetical protein